MKHKLRLLILQSIGALLRCIPLATREPAESLNVLLIRPDHLGDVLLSRPAVERLAQALPQAQITLAVGPWGRAALGAISHQEIIRCPFPGFARSSSSPLHAYLLLLRYALAWRHRRWHYAVIMRPDHWWGALFAALLGIPTRIGYATPETTPFLTHTLPWTPGRHITKEACTLLDYVIEQLSTQEHIPYQSALPVHAPEQAPLLRCATPEDHKIIEALLTQHHIPAETPLVVLHPGAGSLLKSLPLDRFAQVGRALSQDLHAQLIITGAAQEHAITEELAQLLAPNVLNLAGALQWGALEALYARAQIVVGIDSGPLHVAVAASTPSVALFGPADPQQFAPWGSSERHRVVTADLPCRPCRRLDYCMLDPTRTTLPSCMLAIDAPRVIDAAHAALQQRKQSCSES